MKINQTKTFMIGEICCLVYEHKQDYLYENEQGYLICFYSHHPVPKACFLKERFENQTNFLRRAWRLRVEACFGSCRHLKRRNNPE